MPLLDLYPWSTALTLSTVAFLFTITWGRPFVNLLDELGGRKIAVLGDMLELGGYEIEGHCRVGCRAMDVVSLLVTVGERGRLIGQGALDYGMDPERVIQLDDNAAAITYLDQVIQEGDVVLIKGSRGIAMEEIVETLARPPANGLVGNANRGD